MNDTRTPPPPSPGWRGSAYSHPFAADLARERDALAARLAAVEALHRPSADHGNGMKPYCVGCWEACGEEGAPLWPCPTIRALAVAADPAEWSCRDCGATGSLSDSVTHRCVVAAVVAVRADSSEAPA